MPTCTVCLIAKNEAAYLLEWIAYHSLLGFDEIVIYENNSEDNSSEILNKLASKKIITHRPWKLGKTESPQITAYIHAIKNAKTDWILFIDADEFLVFNNGNLQTMLSELDRDKSIGAIGVNWRIFGSAGMEAPDGRLVTERFNKASYRDFAMNNHLKSFIRVKDAGPHIDMHLSDVSGKRVVYPNGTDIEIESRGRSDGVNHEYAQLNHYFTKTIAEYQIKKRRGQAGIGEDSELKYWYTDDAFIYHDRNEEEDNSMAGSIELIKNKIAYLIE